MRRLIAAGILVLCVAVACVIGVRYTSSVCETLETRISDCIAAYEAGDADRAAKAAETLETYWIEVEERLSVFVNHSELDNIGISIAKLSPLAAAGDKAQFLAECKLAKTMVTHLKGDEGFSWHSIF